MSNNREAATSPGKVTGRSPRSKAVPLIILASISLTAWARMEATMADTTVTSRILKVEHLKIDSPKTFAEVEAALDAALPPFDEAISAALV